MSRDVETVKLLTAAAHALRSYEFGNASPDLAREMAGAIEEYLAAPAPPTDTSVEMGGVDPKLAAGWSMPRQLSTTAGDLVVAFRRICVANPGLSDAEISTETLRSLLEECGYSPPPHPAKLTGDYRFMGIKLHGNDDVPAGELRIK
jgi:hypothetical protein